MIDFPLPDCAPELCGRETPNFAMTDIVNPEQSVPFVRLVPPVYIAVSDELYRIVRDLRTLGGNASGLRSGRSVICTALLSAALGAGTTLSGAVLRIALTVRGIPQLQQPVCT